MNNVPRLVCFITWIPDTVRWTIWGSLFFEVWNFLAPNPWIGIVSRETNPGPHCSRIRNIYPVPRPQFWWNSLQLNLCPDSVCVRVIGGDATSNRYFLKWPPNGWTDRAEILYSLSGIFGRVSSGHGVRHHTQYNHRPIFRWSHVPSDLLPLTGMRTLFVI